MRVNKLRYKVGLYRILLKKERRQNLDANEANVWNIWSISYDRAIGIIPDNAASYVSVCVLSVMLQAISGSVGLYTGIYIGAWRFYDDCL